jgi:hypothetical protein
MDGPLPDLRSHQPNSDSSCEAFRINRRPRTQISRGSWSLVEAPVAFNFLMPVCVGLDQAGINCKTFAADQPLLDTAAQHGLEHPPEEIALAEAAMPAF